MCLHSSEPIRIKCFNSNWHEKQRPTLQLMFYILNTYTSHACSKIHQFGPWDPNLGWSMAPFVARGTWPSTISSGWVSRIRTGQIWFCDVFFFWVGAKLVWYDKTIDSHVIRTKELGCVDVYFARHWWWRPPSNTFQICCCNCWTRSNPAKRWDDGMDFWWWLMGPETQKGDLQ